MAAYRAVTATGSVYIIGETPDGFIVSADNKPNEGSRPIVDREWPIEKPDPWPPELGRSISFFCIHFRDHGHPARMPGGGKVTSVVKELTQVE